MKTRSYSYQISVKTKQISQVLVYRHGWWRTLQLHLLDGIGWLYAGLFDLTGHRFENRYISHLVKTDKLFHRTAEIHVIEIPENEQVQETIKQIMLYYGVEPEQQRGAQSNDHHHARDERDR